MKFEKKVGLKKWSVLSLVSERIVDELAQRRSGVGKAETPSLTESIDWERDFLEDYSGGSTEYRLASQRPS